MNRVRIAMLVSGLAVGGLVLTSCGEDLLLPPQSQPGLQIDCNRDVSIVVNASTLGDQSYQPNPITIARGATVTWINNDTVAHTVTATPDDTLFNSGTIQPGESFTHTFDTVGSFDYLCTIHPSMTGTVIVSEDAGACPTATPTESPEGSPSPEPSGSPSAEPTGIVTILSQ